MPHPFRSLTAVTTLSVLVGVALLSAGRATHTSIVQTALAAGQAAPGPSGVAAGEAAARSQCVTCHKVPPPDVLPRAIWRDEVARMFLIRNKQPEPAGPPGTAARMVLLPPDWQAIVRYYEANAPERLPAPEKWPAPDRKVTSAGAS